jgi:hypothetical protein
MTTINTATAAHFVAILAKRRDYNTARRVAAHSLLSGARREALCAAVWRLHGESCPYGGEFKVGTWADMSARSGRAVAWLKRRGSKRAAAWAVWCGVVGVIRRPIDRQGAD